MQRLPRILYIHHNSHAIGGADYCLLKMAKAVRDSGLFDCYVMLSKQTAIVPHYLGAGIPVVSKHFFRLEKSLSATLLPFFALYEILSIRRFIKEHQINLIHTNDLFDFVGNIAAKMCGIPSCQSIRAILRLQKPYNRLITRLCCRSSDRLLCVSESVRQTMFPGCSEKTTVIYDWVDLPITHDRSPACSIREELGLTADAFLFGCIGRMVPRKGQDLFLQAAEIIAERHPNVHFVIIGDPEPKSKYYRHLKHRWQNSLQKARIHFLPGRSDILSVMSQLDVVVNSSTYPDPFPNVVLEAMACGRPVIGADEGGMPEQIIEGVTGFLFKARDAVSLAEKMEQAFTAIRLRTLDADTIRQFYKNRFDRSINLQALLAEYGALLEATTVMHSWGQRS